MFAGDKNFIRVLELVEANLYLTYNISRSYIELQGKTIKYGSNEI